MPSLSRPTITLLLVSGCGASEIELGETPDGGETSGETDGATAPDPELCAPTRSDVLDMAGARSLELVALREDIPGLAEQPTTRGQTLTALAAFDGRLHLGYGDYSDNTGPIAMVAWDPMVEAFAGLGVLPTEEVQVFRIGDGTLYTPATDPDAHQGEGGVYRLDCGSEQWHVGTPIAGAVHTYDLATWDDAIVVGTGSLTGEPALVMRSDDYGESWTELMRRESPAGKFSRFYYVGATPQMLFVSGRDHPDPSASFAWTYADGMRTTLVDPPSRSLIPIALGDDMVVANFAGDPGRGDYLDTYRIDVDRLVDADPWPSVDGAPAELVSWAPGDRADTLVFMFERPGGGVSIQRTDNLSPGVSTWEELVVIDALDGDEFVSMAPLLNDIYLGTRIGSLYAVRQVYVPAP